MVLTVSRISLGVLTIVSLCILPGLLLVFLRADRPFVRSGPPQLIRMALTFAMVASLAGGAWISQYGRAVSLAVFETSGLLYCCPRSWNTSCVLS